MMSAYCKKGENYYVVIYNGGDSETSGVVSATELNETLTTGQNQTLQVDNNITYSKFVVPASSSAVEEYIITLAGAKSLQFVVRDENGDTCNIVADSNGYLDIKDMTPGHTYYIGIWSEINQTLSPNVSKFSGDLYRWQFVDADNNVYRQGAGGVFSLPRGKEYDVRLYVNNLVRYYDIRKTTDTLVGYTELSAIFDNTTSKLTIADDRDLFTTIALTAQNVNGIVANINVVFNQNEIAISKVDIVDKIAIEIARSSLAQKVSYRVSGKMQKDSILVIRA